MRLFLIASFCLAASVLAAQVPQPKASRTETKHIVLSTSASTAEAAPGARVSLFVDVAPKGEMHVYAPEEKNLVPISLKITSVDGVKVHAPKYPKSERFTIESLKETQFGYSKPFRIVQDVTLAAKLAKSPVEITGVLQYQACDTTICYLPVKVPVAWNIAVKP